MSRVVYVMGQAGTGKSTYVQDHRQPGDVVIEEYHLLVSDKRAMNKVHELISNAGENSTVWIVSIPPVANFEFVGPKELEAHYRATYERE